MRDFQERMRKRKYPREPGFRFPFQCRQLFIKTVRHVLLDLPYRPVNLIVIVEQPFGGFRCICRSICAGFPRQTQPIDRLVDVTPGGNGLGSDIRQPVMMVEIARSPVQDTGFIPPVPLGIRAIQIGAFRVVDTRLGLGVTRRNVGHSLMRRLPEQSRTITLFRHG